MTTNNEGPQSGDVDPGIQPLQGRDTTIEPDPVRDPAQAEWEPGRAAQPESQGDDPLIAELGEDGQGDVAPEDL